EAVISCQRGNEIYEQLANADEDRYLGWFAASLKLLKWCLLTAGQFKNAAPVARRQMEVLRHLLAKHPEIRGILAQSYAELAAVLRLNGEFCEARRVAALAEMHQRANAEELNHTRVHNPVPPD